MAQGPKKGHAAPNKSYRWKHTLYFCKTRMTAQDIYKVIFLFENTRMLLKSNNEDFKFYPELSEF